MGARGEHNVGHLCRRHFGSGVYAIGFGTDHGTVLAADAWDAPGRAMQVQPARPESYEGVAHRSGIANFLLPLREPRSSEVREALLAPRLERAIGVVYRPRTELLSHYFEAYLPAQFDEWIWLDETHAVRPVTDGEARGLPRAHPFAPYGPA